MENYYKNIGINKSHYLILSLENTALEPGIIYIIVMDYLEI